MIRSMTGFARRETSIDGGVLAWEIRSVNHRYLEVGLRLPEEFRGAEADFRQAIGNTARRGKVDAALFYRNAGPSGRELELDTALLGQLITQASTIRQKLGEVGTVSATELLRWPGVLREAERDATPLVAAAYELLAETLAEFAGSRASEGGRISEMLATRAEAVLGLADTVAARLPEVHARIQARLQERIGSFVAEGNPERLEQEIVIALQKLDVDEELDRLRSHVTELKKALAGEEAVGRKLDFLMQEFNREANTLSSKSQDVETTRAAVELKVLIEQMREQIQNVE